MALGGVCLFLLASALSHWDEVFLEFLGGLSLLFFFLDLALCLSIKHKVRNMIDSKLTWSNVLLILMLSWGTWMVSRI